MESRDMANHNNFGMGGASRARHSVRAVVCLAKRGAHGVTHPTFSVSEHECVNVIVKCNNTCAWSQSAECRFGLICRGHIQHPA